jgi:hypothetical protein
MREISRGRSFPAGSDPVKGCMHLEKNLNVLERLVSDMGNEEDGVCKYEKIDALQSNLT